MKAYKPSNVLRMHFDDQEVEVRSSHPVLPILSEAYVDDDGYRVEVQWYAVFDDDSDHYQLFIKRVTYMESTATEEWKTCIPIFWPMRIDAWDVSNGVAVANIESM